jgi:hypothetical protein
LAQDSDQALGHDGLSQESENVGGWGGHRRHGFPCPDYRRFRGGSLDRRRQGPTQIFR